MQFILHLDHRRSGFAFLATIKPALSLLTASSGTSFSLSAATNLMLAGAKWRTRAAAGPVRKAPSVLPKDLSAVLQKVFPVNDLVGLAEPTHLRTAFRLLVKYHTLCRLACCRQLRARHFELAGTDILITFPSAKNDQLHRGQSSCLVASASHFCPLYIITRLFFQRFGLSFGAAADDQTFVNFQLRRTNTGVVPIRHRSVSASQATADLRCLLVASGVACLAATDKSVKMSGVTAAFTAGASTEDVMHIGRWHTPRIPLLYKHNSDDFKKSVAAMVPPIAGPALVTD
jgi:hypothetical protein